MDKKIYLLDKGYYSETMVNNLTEDELEDWVMEDTYEDNDTIIKIDANGYDNADAALNDFGFDKNDYYVFTFGF